MFNCHCKYLPYSSFLKTLFFKWQFESGTFHGNRLYGFFLLNPNLAITLNPHLTITLNPNPIKS